MSTDAQLTRRIENMDLERKINRAANLMVAYDDWQKQFNQIRRDMAETETELKDALLELKGMGFDDVWYKLIGESKWEDAWRLALVCRNRGDVWKDRLATAKVVLGK